jgi:hypothetical protein
MMPNEQQREDFTMHKIWRVIAICCLMLLIMPSILTAQEDEIELSELFERGDTYGFEMPYPETWRVEDTLVGQSLFVTVTKGHAFNLANNPEAGEPSAIIAYGRIEDVLGAEPDDQEQTLRAIISTITGVPSDDIIYDDEMSMPFAFIEATNESFQNTFLAVTLDDGLFIAANVFTAPDADEDFVPILTTMMMQVEFTGDTSASLDPRTDVDVYPPAGESVDDGTATLYTHSSAVYTIVLPTAWEPVFEEYEGGETRIFASIFGEPFELSIAPLVPNDGLTLDSYMEALAGVGLDVQNVEVDEINGLEARHASTIRTRDNATVHIYVQDLGNGWWNTMGVSGGNSDEIWEDELFQDALKAITASMTINQ